MGTTEWGRCHNGTTSCTCNCEEWDLTTIWELLSGELNKHMRWQHFKAPRAEAACGTYDQCWDLETCLVLPLDHGHHGHFLFPFARIFPWSP